MPAPGHPAPSSGAKKLPSKKTFAPGRRKAVTVAAENLVRTSYLSPGQTLPLIIEPTVPGLDPVAWAAKHLREIEEQLTAHGAILFRGFALPESDDFSRFSRTILPHLANYVEGSSPRVQTGDKVYTSTEYPADQFVSMHNELSYAHRWPSKLFFYCLVAPGRGGETPIADSRKVLELLSPATREKFVAKGVRYLRHLHAGRGAGLSWQTVFETEDRDAVEAYCRGGEIDFEWLENGGLRTEQKRPAVRTHPKTGDTVWFNQVDQWHPSNLGAEVAERLLAQTPPEELPIYATFGDGAPFGDRELEEVREAFRQAMVVFPWQQGDALLVDNVLAAHGRMPFEGPRKILVVMGESTFG